MLCVSHRSSAQADIDSAFRRMTIRREGREFSHIASRLKDQALVTKHLALMFGSTASVHRWERIGVLGMRLATWQAHIL